MNFSDLGKEIIKNVGGVENINSLYHCTTRLRFELKDENKANTAAIKKLPLVLGVTSANGQYMIVLGKNVAPTYEAIMEEYHLSDKIQQSNNSKKLTWKKAGKVTLDYIQASVTPMIPALIAGGMFKVFLLIITAWIAPSFAKTSSYMLLSAIADAPFYFMPIMVAYGAALKLKATPTYAMMATASLLYPSFHELLNKLMANPHLASPTLFNLPVKVVNYGTSLLPALLISLAAYYAEKLLNKIIPGILKTVFVGVGTIFIAGSLGFLILGPVGNYLGEIIAQVIIFLGKTVGPLATGLLAAALPWLVMTGMHAAIAPFMPQLINNPGYDPLIRPAFLLHNMAEGGANIGVGLRTKNKKLRSEAFSLAVDAIFAGVTEPSLYGINLKYKRPMYGVMAGGFVGGLTAGLLGAKAYLVGFSTIFAIALFEKTALAIIIGIIVTIVVSAAVTYVLGFDENQEY
ncbi:PTS transporter subunit EIIC [Lactobacillus sp. LL6]|uniref:PTS transporter subunit EIIC n=1 Tax=Lactobacillus sp. LL6 TaxID=2596827 RepID=UPI001184F401|nr:PTS transporter subunit EIIC [Lactobacillus sp. LL6]TSO25364.1 PTS beta-glucoside transporter subunit EIIBCA [Lactobacillus sp. LL6]